MSRGGRKRKVEEEIGVPCDGIEDGTDSPESEPPPSSTIAIFNAITKEMVPK